MRLDGVFGSSWGLGGSSDPRFGSVEFGVKLGGRCIPKAICLLAKG